MYFNLYLYNQYINLNMLNKNVKYKKSKFLKLNRRQFFRLLGIPQGTTFFIKQTNNLISAKRPLTNRSPLHDRSMLILRIPSLIDIFQPNLL